MTPLLPPRKSGCPNCGQENGAHLPGCIEAPPVDRPSLVGDGMNPAGHTCSKCGEREATMAWGDLMSINHGGGEWRCDTCALTEQLEHARERAAEIPGLERQLREAREANR